MCIETPKIRESRVTDLKVHSCIIVRGIVSIEVPVIDNALATSWTLQYTEHTLADRQNHHCVQL